MLEMPSFRNLSTLDPEIHSFLKTTRCRLNGGNDTKPRGWLLSGNRKGIVQSWPDSTKPLILLEQPHPAIDQLLRAECRLSSGPIWLFRIGADGTARQVIAGTVRPGSNYVLVTTGFAPRANEVMSSCTLNCVGAMAFRLTIPEQVSSELHSWIGDLGLHVARTIRVWPAGLPGRGWDGEGSSEWLTTEAPCVGVSHDHPVDAYNFCLNEGSEHIIRTDGTTDPQFFCLPPLPAGIHRLTVKARRSNDLEAVVSSSAAKGFLQLTVREPEPWTAGVASHSGMIVTIDPAEPDLDTLWRNEVRLYVYGPEGYSASLTVELQAADGRQILNERVGAPIDLPITPEKWRRRFQQFLKHRQRAESYFEAARGTLTIDAETLGSRSIVFEHEFKPLRWLTRRPNGDIVVKLVDDTGHEGTEAKVYHCDMERPLEMTPLLLDKVRAGLVVDSPGGLFCAVHSKYKDIVAVSKVTTEKDLTGLGFSLSFGNEPRNSKDLCDALQLLTTWHEARLSGFLIKLRHQQVVDGILDVLYGALCGQDWMRAEAQYRASPNSPIAVRCLSGPVDKRPSFAADLVRGDWSCVKADPIVRTSWFAEVAACNSVCNDRSLCEFALRLASQPQALSAFPVSELDSLISRISNHRAMLRGARLLALLTASHDDVPVSSLPRWRW